MTAFDPAGPLPTGTQVIEASAGTGKTHAISGLAVRYLADGGATTRMNLGVGHGNSVKEIVDAAARATGRQVPARYAPRRAGDPPELVADPGLANRTLGWKAQWTDIEAVIRSAWAWHQSRAESVEKA